MTPALPPPHTRSIHNRRWLSLIVGLAVGLRLALAIVHPFWFPDSTDYDILAREILNHQPWETPTMISGIPVGTSLAARMPGYSFFVALIYAASHDSLLAVMGVQACIGGLVVLLTHAIAKSISPAIGLIAATLAAIDPLSVAFSAAFLSETPFTLCLLLSLWLSLRLIESADTPVNRPANWTRWAALGVIWGIAVYLRASALWCLLPLGGVILICVASRSNRAAVQVNALGALLAVILMFAALSPWLIRNDRLFHSGPLRLTTLEGISLYEAVYPDADGSPKQDKLTWPPDILKMTEPQRNDEWSRRAWQFIKTDPMRIARLAVVKIGRTWSPQMNAQEFRNPAVQIAMLAWHLPLFLFGLIGLFSRTPSAASTSGTAPWKFLLLIPLVYFTLVHALFLGSVRYRVPLMPLVCVFAAVGISIMFKRIMSRKRSPMVRV